MSHRVVAIIADSIGGSEAVEQLRSAAGGEEVDLQLIAAPVLEKAQETKTEATEMMSTYLGGDSDGLDGFEFLTMAEAGEVGHWTVLGKLNETAGESEISELVEWALPIQARHFADVKDGSLKLAGEKDSYEES